eukprot:scaffold2651_cov171-Amphora_coffeaeformis.AAC.1
MKASAQKPNLTKEQKAALIADLLDNSEVVDGKRRLAHGAAARSAFKFGMSLRQVCRLWRQANENRNNGNGSYSVSPRKAGNVGREIVFERGELEKAVEAIPWHKQRTIRDLAEELGISVGMTHRLIRNKNILHNYSSPLKPLLSEQDKIVRNVVLLSNNTNILLTDER